MFTSIENFSVINTASYIWS